jgi:hypothetical protein
MCKQQALLRQSHIVPEFLYEEVYVQPHGASGRRAAAIY